MEKIYYLAPARSMTWVMALIFIAGNIAMPQLVHLLPVGGPVLLPIYFFTLVGAYKCGVWVGLATAIASPVANHLLFGMPAEAMLAPIVAKGVLLALAAAMAAKRTGRVSLIAIICVVATYQVLGSAIEWILLGDFSVAVQDFRIGIPGMMLQIFGGWLMLKALAKV